MTSSRYESPLRGEPRTVQSFDENGLPRFVVDIAELTPRSAQARDGINDFVGNALLLLTGFILLASGFNVVAAVAFGGVAFIVYVVISGMVTSAFKKRTRLVIEADSVSLPGLIRSPVYARNIRHAFQLVGHDDALEEQLRHDLEVREAAARGEVLQKKAYFGQSLHVALFYVGHRIDIAEVYGVKEATAIINRLNYCDSVIDQALNMGRDTGFSPQDDWPKNGPGSL